MYLEALPELVERRPIISQSGGSHSQAMMGQGYPTLVADPIHVGKTRFELRMCLGKVLLVEVQPPQAVLSLGSEPSVRCFLRDVQTLLEPLTGRGKVSLQEAGFR